MAPVDAVLADGSLWGSVCRREMPSDGRLDGLDGARIWTGHGVLAHNQVKIAATTG